LYPNKAEAIPAQNPTPVGEGTGESWAAGKLESYFCNLKLSRAVSCGLPGFNGLGEYPTPLWSLPSGWGLKLTDRDILLVGNSERVNDQQRPSSEYWESGLEKKISQRESMTNGKRVEYLLHI
jgi:hypothetical protein